MERRQVVSSNISEVGYHEGSETLEVLFRNGRMYQYFGVPSRVYQELVGSESCGGYLNREVKGRFRYARV